MTALNAVLVRVADGVLGVCFGRVITANSPASQGEHPSNWEAVLWHEFCHVVTLKKTRNNVEFLMQIQKTTLGPGQD